MKIVINKKDQLGINSGAALAIKKLAGIKYILGLTTKKLKSSLRRPKDNPNGRNFLKIMRCKKARDSNSIRQKDKNMSS